MACEYLCQKWHITKPVQIYDFDPRGMKKLIDYMRKFDGSKLNGVNDNLFKLDFVKAYAIYDQIKAIG